MEIFVTVITSLLLDPGHQHHHESQEINQDGPAFQAGQGGGRKESKHTHRKLGVIIIIIFWNTSKARMPTCLNQGRGRG